MREAGPAIVSMTWAEGPVRLQLSKIVQIVFNMRMSTDVQT